MNNEQLNELIDVLEKIRSVKYPDIPAGVIKGIVMAQFENQDNRERQRTSTIRIINQFLISVSNGREGAE